MPEIEIEKINISTGGIINTLNKIVAAIKVLTDSLIGADGWTSVSSFSNSWVNFGGAFNNASYFIDSFGVVHLKGLIKTGTIGLAAFTLPAGYRPSAEERFSTTSNSLFGQLKIDASGNVIPLTGSNVDFSLDGITFRANGF